MAIPWEWLVAPTTPADVEEVLADRDAPEIWLRSWRQLVEGMGPGDELWEYGDVEYAETPIEAAERIPGFEQVMDRQVLERLGLADPEDRDYCLRDGYAIVRGDRIVDWIESPP